jgi:hypothetical protein
MDSLHHLRGRHGFPGGGGYMYAMFIGPIFAHQELFVMLGVQQRHVCRQIGFDNM